jgi:hypothetical protein
MNRWERGSEQVAAVESSVSSSKMKPGLATMMHNELPISLTWHANCHVVRPS